MRIVVVGGGVAGLACSARLAERGHAVTLFDARPTVGEAIAPWVGDARALGAFARRIGATLRRSQEFSLSSLPLFDRLKLTATLARPPRASDFETVERWLDRIGQSAEARRRLWHPLVRAALAEEPSAASAKLLETLVRERVLDGVELEAGWAEAAADFVEAHGGRVVTAAPVRALEVLDRVARAVLLDGERAAADAIVAAVGARALARLVPVEERRESWFAALDRLAAPHRAGAEALRPSMRSPIAGLYAAAPWVRTGLPANAESAARAADEAMLAACAFVPPPPRVAPPTAAARSSRSLPVVG